MIYRAFFGMCVGSFLFVACSSDETAPAGPTPSPDGGSTGGSVGTGGAKTGGSTGTGGRNSGGAGGAATGGGGTATGGGGAGGTATDGGGAGGTTTDGGDSSTGNGGTGTGGAATGGAGGANTGGVATDGGSCSVLSACCSAFAGRRRNACENIANSGNAANCTAVEELFCGDGGTVGPPGGDGGGGDAFVNCTALKTCCDALADGGRAARQCDRVVTNGNNATCNQVSAIFCN
jgi:hypothetical protein